MRTRSLIQTKRSPRRKYLSQDPEVMGGKTVIAGTRVPISRLLFLLKDGYTIDAIANDYPHLGKKTITGALNEAIVCIEKPNAPFLQTQIPA